MTTKMSLLGPLAKLYLKLNGQLTKPEEKTILNLLVGKQLTRNESGELNNVTDIFMRLETKGFISKDNLELVKQIINAIDRPPLLVYVSECESELKECKKLQSQLERRGETSSHDVIRTPSKTVQGIETTTRRDDVEPPWVKDDLQRSVLFLNDEWGTSKGGISSVNRQLALQARDAGYAVHVTVLDPPSDEDKEDAENNGINLIRAETIPGIDQNINLNILNNGHKRYFPSLEKNMRNLDVIIGHVPITSVGALNIKHERFQNAYVHLFTHVIPQDTDFHRGRSYKLGDIETKVDTIIQQAEQADLIFSVGPKVYRKFRNEFRGSQVNDDKHKQFIPTPDSSFFDVNLKPFAKDDVFEILTVGRVSNVESLKGYDIVAAALGKVATESKNLLSERLLWRIRGISEEDKHKSLAYIEKHLKSVNGKFLDINPLQYGTQEQITKDIRKSRLFLMPSRTEPFGMVGLEAIAAGIPVLVTENSGLADFLREYFPKHIYEPMIVSQLGTSDIDLESDINIWADRITDVLFTKYDDTFALAQEVKEKLKKMKDQQSTQIFKDELLKLSPKS